MEDFYLQQLKYVKSLSSRHAAEAASRGHLRALKYIHESGGSMDCHACYNAALNGHLFCLKYLVETVQCPYNYNVLLGLTHSSCESYVETLKPRLKWCCF